MGTYDVRTLAFKGTNSIGDAEVIRKTCIDEGCDILGLQEVRATMDEELSRRRAMLCFAQEQTEESTKKRGITG